MGLVGIAGGALAAVTLAACYGPPPPVVCSGPDADQDGYAASCDQPEEIDCNDDDASVHPYADDAEGDGIDQNCDGVDGIAQSGADAGE